LPDGTLPHFMKEFSCVKEFQFVQGAIDHLTVRLVPGEGWDTAMRDYMEKELRRYVGPAMKVDFDAVPELERAASDKYRMVISKVPVESRVKAR